jgi:hypothetical protein
LVLIVLLLCSLFWLLIPTLHSKAFFCVTNTYTLPSELFERQPIYDFYVQKSYIIRCYTRQAFLLIIMNEHYPLPLLSKVWIHLIHPFSLLFIYLGNFFFLFLSVLQRTVKCCSGISSVVLSSSLERDEMFRTLTKCFQVG